MKAVFEVEQAGCESCAKLIRTALSEVGDVESVDVDEDADRATVVLADPRSRAAVDAALSRASAGAGHDYRVRTCSWRTSA